MAVSDSLASATPDDAKRPTTHARTIHGYNKTISLRKRPACRSTGKTNRLYSLQTIVKSPNNIM